MWNLAISFVGYCPPATSTCWGFNPGMPNYYHSCSQKALDSFTPLNREIPKDVVIRNQNLKFILRQSSFELVGTSCMETYIVPILSISFETVLSLLPCYSVTMLRCYSVPACYSVTLLLCYLVTLLPCYSVTLFQGIKESSR